MKKGLLLVFTLVLGCVAAASLYSIYGRGGVVAADNAYHRSDNRNNEGAYARVRGTVVGESTATVFGTTATVGKAKASSRASYRSNDFGGEASR